jgi:hypothetical protein
MTRAICDAVIIIFLLFSTAQIALAEDAVPSSTSRQVPVFLDIEPANPQLDAIPNPDETLIILPGSPVRISGAVSLELVGKQILLTITTPDQGWDIDPNEVPRRS